MIPDLEKAVSNWLRDTLDVRVVGRPPDSKTTPWVQVVQLSADQEARASVDHLTAFLVQFDCYAGGTGGQPEAIRIGREVRAALQDFAGTTTADAVVAGVRVVGHARIPDTALEPARERVILTARIWAH